MFLRCQKVADGPGPSEIIVGVTTVDGRNDEVIIYKGLYSGGFIDIGPIVESVGDKVLIELPRESASGRGRIWVSSSQVIERTLQAAE